MNQAELVGARVAKRREMYETVVCRDLPKNPVLTVPQIIGHYSRTDTRGAWGIRRRFIVRYDSVRIGDLIETPTSAARDYLKVNNYRPRRLRGSLQYESIGRILKRFSQTPAFSKPGRFEEGEYIDIQAAFFSIMAIAGWDLTYAPGRYFAPGRSVADFPFAENKISRNSMVSAAQVAEFRVAYPPGDQSSERIQKRQTEFTNPQLIAVISDVLHSIARLAQEAGAIYGNVDGFIAPDPATAGQVKQVIADFGLLGRVKHRGEGFVNSVGSYAIGDFQTANIRRGMRSAGSSNVINVDYLKWLQKNFESAAARQ